MTLLGIGIGVVGFAVVMLLRHIRGSAVHEDGDRLGDQRKDVLRALESMQKKHNSDNQ